MDPYLILNLRQRPALRMAAAEWFHRRWDVPLREYLDSIDESLAGQADVPQWYVALSADEIIGGVGVIANDFHLRKDLTPNVCALFVEEKHRGRGLAGRLLERVCSDMKQRGIATLYLVTDHTSFYERYGWTFLCPVQEEAGGGTIRMYRRDL